MYAKDALYAGLYRLFVIYWYIVLNQYTLFMAFILLRYKTNGISKI